MDNYHIYLKFYLLTRIILTLSYFVLLFGLVSLDKAVEIITKYRDMFNLKKGEKLLNEPNNQNYL